MKIRIWDKKLQKFVPWNSVLCHDFDAEEYVYQEFTGLTDKNGADIYAGDILKCRRFEDWFDDIGYEVVLVATKEQKQMGESDSCGYLYLPKDRLIIGNILENPELTPKYYE